MIPSDPTDAAVDPSRHVLPEQEYDPGRIAKPVVVRTGDRVPL
jgi:hypothetical protein